MSSITREQLTERPPQTSKFIDMTGWQNGKLTVTGFAGWYGKLAMWNTHCECGRNSLEFGSHLRQRAKGHPYCAKCQCERKPKPEKTTEYRAWRYLKTMHNRELCAEWLVCEQFMADMGIAPDDTGCVGRLDASKPYCKENCIWCSGEDVRRLSHQRLFEYQGETLNITQWAARLGISKERMRQRFESHSIERAITYKYEKPPKRKKESVMARKASDVDPIIDKAVENESRAQLITKESFTGEVAAVRAKLVTRAKNRGLNVSTHKYNDEAFWVLALPKPPEPVVQS